MAYTISPIAIEQAEQTFYINYLREGIVVFDVGANNGEFALVFSRIVQPDGKYSGLRRARLLSTNYHRW